MDQPNDSADPEFQNDGAAWMPRDPYLAVVQSVAQRVLLRNAGAVDGSQSAALPEICRMLPANP